MSLFDRLVAEALGNRTELGALQAVTQRKQGKRVKSLAMKKDDVEFVRGSGNVFRDFDRPNASVEQTREILAAEIIRALDKQGLSTREAEKLTGVGYSEFSRIRNARLSRFTLDRMITILEKLDGNIEVGLTFQPRRNKMRDGLHI
jgi:predicted XRE-type DNA-binding protein